MCIVSALSVEVESVENILCFSHRELPDNGEDDEVFLAVKLYASTVTGEDDVCVTFVNSIQLDIMTNFQSYQSHKNINTDYTFFRLNLNYLVTLYTLRRKRLDNYRVAYTYRNTDSDNT